MNTLSDQLGAYWSYYSSFALLLLALVAAIAFARRIWRLKGTPLTSWIRQKRRNPTSDEAHQLLAVQAILDTLAHDVLKHRLLGLVSLVQSLDVLEQEIASDGQSSAEHLTKTHPEQWEGLRSELLRLCGARAAPHERLWARWSDAFDEVRRVSGGKVLPPAFDLSLRKTDRTLQRLRKLVRRFVAGENEDALSPEKVKALDLPSIGGVHGQILRAAEASKPLIAPRRIVEDALSAVSSLVGRKGASRRVSLVFETEQAALANASGRVISKSLERLLDNALRLSPQDAPIALLVQMENDELLGDDLLVFRLLDTLPSWPSVDDYGEGLRGAKRELAEFECGLSFNAINEAELPPSLSRKSDTLVKEAKITVPISHFEELPLTHRALAPLLKATAGLAFVSLIALSATSRILGGAPVQFAGGGEPVVEFRVSAGEKLSFALCEGGREPSVAIQLEHDACRPPHCTLAHVLDRLEPCSHKLSSPECPGLFSWTPSFKDGSRQGSSYELTIACHSPGPPKSEDVRRVRIVVSRPNSPPQVFLTQLTQDDQVYVLPFDEGLDIDAGGDVTIQAFARDEDDDPLLYTLTLPNQESIESYDGRFALGQLSWSAAGSWRATLTVSDGVAPPIAKELFLYANRLRPIELRNFSLRLDGLPLPCLGEGNARLCEITDEATYIAQFDLWFDPLIGRIDERLKLFSPEDGSVFIQTVDPKASQEEAASFELPLAAQAPPQPPSLHQRWVIRSRYSGRTLAHVELIELPADSLTNTRRYGFAFKIEQLASNDPQHWTLRLQVEEISGRTESLDMVLVLARSDAGKRPPFEVSPRLVRLSEQVLGSRRHNSSADIHIFFFNQDQTATLAEPEIHCNNPSLEEAFTKPILTHQGQGEWSLTLTLKPGCINGLGGAQSYFGRREERTCDVLLSSDDGAERTSVKVILEDRPCPPNFEELNSTPSEELPEGESLAWNIALADPDGDLTLDGIHLHGGEGKLKLKLEKDTLAKGSRFVGTVSGSLSCNDLRHSISIEANDQRGLRSKRSLSPQLTCPPLVSTPNGQLEYMLDEDQEFSLGLEAPSDVQLLLESGPGQLNGSTYAWQPSCDNGRGPYQVEIAGLHTSNYGTPLTFAILVSRCKIRWELHEGSKPLDLSLPIILNPGQQRNFEMVPLHLLPQDLEFTITLADTDAPFELSRTDASSTFNLRCDTPGKSTLQLGATPLEEVQSKALPAETITIPVLCEEPKNEPTP